MCRVYLITSYFAINITVNSPNFVINPPIFINLESPDLVENFWFVEADQVMDYNIRGPEKLEI